MSQPLLSIGMIVKNEERCLEKCLKSLEPLRQAIPCELIIADTGSTDKTVEIASKYADILFDFEWVNDFSAARNAVMERSSGKWFLTLDADEYFATGKDEIAKFLKSPSAEKMYQATVVIRNHFSKNLDGNYSDFNAIRMCRMNLGTRYTGAIHEHFDTALTYDDIYIFNDVLFDHDGYAFISPEHKAKKEARNIELLEKKLKDDPDSLRTILQCLESSAANASNRRYYTQHAREKLLSVKRGTKDWESAAANTAKQVALYMNYDSDPAQEEWFNWTFKTFPNSEHTTIDTKYVYVKYLYSKNKFQECIKAGKEYLTAVETRKKQSNKATLESITLSLLHANVAHRSEIRAIIANAMLEEDRSDEAVKILTQTELDNVSVNIINNWFKAVSNIPVTQKNISQISNLIKSLFNKISDSSNRTYTHVFSKISELFENNQTSDSFMLFSEVSPTLEACAKILNSTSKEEVEKLLSKTENWDEFMASALKKSLILMADLPNELYSVSSSRLAYLINELTKSSGEILDVISEHYADMSKFNSWPHVSFIFNLMLSLVFNTEESLKPEEKSKFLKAFVIIANEYLNTCYNPELLKNEESVAFIPVLHLFCWYLVKATNEKDAHPLEYIKTLRTALAKVPQAKSVVEFLIEEFQKEEEQRKKANVTEATPELIAMAQQLKTMLSAFAPNDPQLLAIKQSPLYKQVAFLIEE